jgi:magnesium-transporting ATPase (P-type)
VLLDELRTLIAAGCVANDAALREVDGAWQIQGDPTEAAFLVAEAKIDRLADARCERFERVGEIPFTSERKLITTLQADAEHGGAVAAVTRAHPTCCSRAAPPSASRAPSWRSRLSAGGDPGHGRPAG